MKILLIVFPLLLAASSASASVYVKLGLLYQTRAEGPEGTAETSRVLTDLGAGYLSDRGWLLGVIQSTESGTVGRSATGLSMGWVSAKDGGGWFAVLNYYLSASLSPWTGSGYQIDLGYLFRVRSMAFGPQLSKRAITYDKSDGDALDPKQIYSGFDPFFTFWIFF